MRGRGRGVKKEFVGACVSACISVPVCPCACVHVCMHVSVSVCMHMRVCVWVCVCVCVLVCVNTAANQMIFRALTSHRTLPQPGRFHSDRSTAPSPVTSPQVCDKPGLKPVRIPVKLTAMIHGLKLQHFWKYQLKVSILYCTKT